MLESLFFIFSTVTIGIWCFACGNGAHVISGISAMGDAGKTQPGIGNQEQIVKECFAMTNWTK